MKKITKKFYHIISSLAMSVAVLSITQLNAFCILIIHQPDIPNQLKQKVGLLSEGCNENINV